MGAAPLIAPYWLYIYMLLQLAILQRIFLTKFVVNLILAPRNSQACFYSLHFNIPNLQLAKIGVQ